MMQPDVHSSAKIDRVALRAELRQRRAAITAPERIAAASAIVEHLEEVPEFLTDTRLAGYWAVAGEVPLAAIFGGLRAREQIYHLPVVSDDKSLRFAPWRAGIEIAANRYGIPEPVVAPDALVAADALDVVLVPLLGFDRRGYRLGFGGGFYDRTFRFLNDCTRPAQPILIGIGYALQEVAAIDAEAWDVRLDYVVTERELVACTTEA